MPITSITSDPEALTLTIVADYPVPVARLWAGYADPRQLERFWGPVEWPAKFTRHDMVVGGRSEYVMTGPDGTKSAGWFKFLDVQPEKLIEVEDGFSDEHGQPNPDMPTMRMVFAFSATPTGSRFVSTTWFTNAEAMEELVKMGMIEGTKSAMSQIDAVLLEG